MPYVCCAKPTTRHKFEFKTRPKQLIGYLPLDIALPVITDSWYFYISLLLIDYLLIVPLKKTTVLRGFKALFVWKQ